MYRYILSIIGFMLKQFSFIAISLILGIFIVCTTAIWSHAENLNLSHTIAPIPMGDNDDLEISDIGRHVSLEIYPPEPTPDDVVWAIVTDTLYWRLEFLNYGCDGYDPLDAWIHIYMIDYIPDTLEVNIDCYLGRFPPGDYHFGTYLYYFARDSTGRVYPYIYTAVSAEFTVTEETGIDGTGGTIAFHLWQNYPNPFVSQTTIPYCLLAPSYVDLSIYDTAGRLVRALVGDRRQSGDRTVTWDGYTSEGKAAPAGVYFYRLKTDHFSESKRLVLGK